MTSWLGQYGLAKETTHGTYAAPSRFLEVTKAKPAFKPERQAGGGLAAGLLAPRSSRYVETHRHAEFELETVVLPKGYGLLFEQIFGIASTPVQQAATAAYLQTYTLNAGIKTKSATQQVGVPEHDGTVNDYSALGCRVTEAEFTFDGEGMVTLSVTWDCQDLTEAQTLASATYTGAAEAPFHGAQWACLVHNSPGSEAAVSGVKKVTIKIEWPQYTEGWYANAAGLRAEPTPNDLPKVTGTITSDYLDKATFNDRFAAMTGFSMINRCTGANIASTYDRQVSITLPKCFLTGDTPGIEGNEPVSGDWPFEVFYDNTNPPITLTYMSSDTTA